MLVIMVTNFKDVAAKPLVKKKCAILRGIRRWYFGLACVWRHIVCLVALPAWPLYPPLPGAGCAGLSSKKIKKTQKIWRNIKKFPFLLLAQIAGQRKKKNQKTLTYGYVVGI